MEQLKQILEEHRKRYSKMLIEDLAKLIYQHEFGCGHFITDKQASLYRLKQEMTKTKMGEATLFEDIGNGFSRLNLQAAKGKLSPELINSFFVRTAEVSSGTIEEFTQKLELIKEFYPANEVDSYLQGYKAKGYPAISHSQIYKSAYNPAYRVVGTIFSHYLALFLEIEKVLAKQDFVVVAIDGPSGSGKSTLAQLLAEIYDAPVAHMDHFFLQSEQRTKKRLETPGGNVDHERFAQEVLTQIKGEGSFNYNIYDCQTNTFTPSDPLVLKPVRVVEGSYSLHPKLRANYDLKVFLAISPQSQRERILERNGPLMFKRFVDEWIPLENLYFRTCDVQNQSDLIFAEYKHGLMGNSGSEE